MRPITHTVQVMGSKKLPQTAFHAVSPSLWDAQACEQVIHSLSKGWSTICGHKSAWLLPR